jgi:hypothetical protein
MNGANLRLLLAYVIIPFAMGAGFGVFFLFRIYWLDVGGMRTLRSPQWKPFAHG